MLFFTATGKHDVLFAQLDLLHRIANTVRAGGTGGGDGVVNTLDFERRGQTGGDSTAHGPGHPVGADALNAFFPHHIGGFDNVLRGGTAGGRNQTGARMGYLLGGQAGIFDGLLHGDKGIGRRIAHKTQGLTVYKLFKINVYCARYLAAKTVGLIAFVKTNARATCFKAVGHLILGDAQARGDANPCNYNAFH